MLHLFNQTAIEVCEGQQMDMDFETRSDVSIDDYVEMIRLKTSVLLGCALEIGAIIANASESNRRHIYDFGQHIGIAFQIQDDILDLYADPEKFGKQVGGDVIANKKTLLNLKAFELADTEQKEILHQLSGANDLNFKVEKTRELYDQLGARTACVKIMLAHYDLAMTALNELEVDAAAKEPLIGLADFLMMREV